MRANKARVTGAAKAASWRWRLLTALLCLSVILTQLPATWSATAINVACGGQCRVAEAEGVWWRGKARLFVRLPGREHWFNLGPLTWALNPFLARTELRLGAGSIKLAWQRGGLGLGVEGVVLPASWLLVQPVFQLPGAGWQGEIAIRQGSLHWPWRGQPEGDGQIVWQAAASSLLEDYPLGDLEMRWLYRQGGGLQARIEGGKPGQLAVNAQMLWQSPQSGAGAQGKLTGEITLANDAEARLARYLQLIARPLGGGRYALQWLVT